MAEGEPRVEELRAFAEKIDDEVDLVESLCGAGSWVLERGLESPALDFSFKNAIKFAIEKSRWKGRAEGMRLSIGDLDTLGEDKDGFITLEITVNKGGPNG